VITRRLGLRRQREIAAFVAAQSRSGARRRCRRPVELLREIVDRRRLALDRGLIAASSGSVAFADREAVCSQRDRERGNAALELRQALVVVRSLCLVPMLHVLP
jgi:hypothetical protein